MTVDDDDDDDAFGVSSPPLKNPGYTPLASETTFTL